ncbi:MAG: tetratricopeptide repeat protein [Acidobacteria bacterium]|nr:tetratricopeptide repeat protein [Acidobacteriota bacterium]
MSIAAGDRFGPYEIVVALGAGGMGQVYRARDRRLDRDVAIKVLPPHLSENPQALARFVKETKALAALSHPNLLAIFDTGVENGTTYAVTELLEGQTIRQLISKGPVEWKKVVEIGAAVADGLEAAHSKGITHRDIKPENLFLTANGFVKVLDFGIAHVAPAVSGDETLTASGLIVGTPGYLSPEQVRGESSTPASDIFSLGVVLYEMLCGRRAFTGATAAEAMSSILRDRPAELSNVPAELKRLVDACLEKDTFRRVQSARELAAQLRTAPAQTPGDSIAVLPFVNASNDPDSEYLSEGLTESILNSLAGIPQLRVIPRSTVFRYKGSDKDPQTLGRELNVRVVLTGRVSLRGEVLVIGTELLDVQEGSQLWGERFNRKLSDIFAIEEEIAAKISSRLRTKLSGVEKKKRHTDDTEAYQLYLKGRHHWTRRTPDELMKAVTAFQQAIDKDPEYALAYSGLADCYSILASYSILPPKPAFARAKAAAAAAIAFDNELAEAHNSLAYIHGLSDFNWRAADKEFARSLELNANNLLAHYWWSIILSMTGRVDDGEAHIRRGIEMEPLSPLIGHAAAMSSLYAGRTEEALDRARSSIANNPGFFISHMWAGTACLLLGRFEVAITHLERACELSDGRTSWVVGALGHAHAVAGNSEAARQILSELTAREKTETVDLTALAIIHEGLGETDGALAWLEKAVEARGLVPVLFPRDPRFASLRAHPRGKAILRKLNLAEESNQ